MHINVSIPDKISRAKKQDHSIDQLVNATVSMSSSMEQSNRRTNVDNASEQGHHSANFEIEALEAARGAALQRSLGHRHNLSQKGKLLIMTPMISLVEHRQRRLMSHSNKGRDLLQMGMCNKSRRARMTSKSEWTSWKWNCKCK
ncbi:hypothetical protein JHK82_050197 [Glycine max]|nr:hypothetical protein JHK82_050197 [Glycine max]